VRARELAEEIVEENAACDDIVLAWVGLGRRALPAISTLYAHPDREVRYYAALAGLQLGDDLAIEPLSQTARDSESAHRFQAIRTLGQAHNLARAARPLRALLDDVDSAVRVAAYEALIERNDPDIVSRPIGGDAFFLDLVPTTGPNLVYAKRGGSRRIAVFGEQVVCRPPLFYAHPSGALTLNAFEGDGTVTVVRNSSRPRRRLPSVQADWDVVKLIELLGSNPSALSNDGPGGLAVDYGMIIHLLYELGDTGSINTRFMLEQPGLAELIGPTRPADRPESELE
jgi:hypothetical protein